MYKIDAFHISETYTFPCVRDYQRESEGWKLPSHMHKLVHLYIYLTSCTASGSFLTHCKRVHQSSICSYISYSMSRNTYGRRLCPLPWQSGPRLSSEKPSSLSLSLSVLCILYRNYVHFSSD